MGSVIVALVKADAVAVDTTAARLTLMSQPHLRRGSGSGSQPLWVELEWRSCRSRAVVAVGPAWGALGAWAVQACISRVTRRLFLRSWWYEGKMATSKERRALSRRWDDGLRSWLGSGGGRSNFGHCQHQLYLEFTGADTVRIAELSLLLLLLTVVLVVIRQYLS